MCVGNSIRARYQGGGTRGTKGGYQGYQGGGNTPGFRVAMRMDGGKWGRGGALGYSGASNHQRLLSDKSANNGEGSLGEAPTY